MLYSHDTSGVFVNLFKCLLVILLLHSGGCVSRTILQGDPGLSGAANRPGGYKTPEKDRKVLGKKDGLVLGKRF